MEMEKNKQTKQKTKNLRVLYILISILVFLYGLAVVTIIVKN